VAHWSCLALLTCTRAWLSRGLGRAGRALQGADVDVGDEPAVRRARGHERDPEPAGVIASLPPRLPGQDPDHDRRGAIAAGLRVLHREGAVHQAVAEPGQPLLAGQHETQRAHAGEVTGEELPEEAGVVLLLGGGPVLDQVERVRGVLASGGDGQRLLFDVG